MQVDNTLEEAPGSKNGCSLVTTAEELRGLTGTANDLLRSKNSSRENLSLHLSSKDLRSSQVGLLLCLHLLDFGEPSERFFFCVDSTEDGLSVLTRPNRVTSEGSTRVGVVSLETSDFFCSPRSFLNLYVGLASCCTWAGVNTLYIWQSSFLTQGLSPTPFSRHLAHFLWLSKRAIMCPQEPRFCPGDDMVVSKLVEISSTT